MAKKIVGVIVLVGAVAFFVLRGKRSTGEPVGLQQD